MQIPYAQWSICFCFFLFKKVYNHATLRLLVAGLFANRQHNSGVLGLLDSEVTFKTRCQQDTFGLKAIAPFVCAHPHCAAWAYGRG